MKKLWSIFFAEKNKEDETDDLMALARILGGLPALLEMKEDSEISMKPVSKKTYGMILGGKVTIEIVFDPNEHKLTEEEERVIEGFIQRNRAIYEN